MSKHEAEPLWKCGACGETHDDEDEAADCCRPEIIEVWGCPVCKDIHYEEKDALHCCGPQGLTRCPCCARDYSEAEINHYAVEIAGHCNVCNPFFTVDQQLAIQDKHWERAGWNDRQRLL